jgi:uncharacterized protein YegP (UPF0339 family)
MADRPYPSFLIYLDNAGEYRWRFQAAGNHKTLADSGEGYTTYAACAAGIAHLQASGSSPIWRTNDAALKQRQTG